MKTVEEVIARQREVVRQIAALDSEYGVQALPEDRRSEYAGLKREHDELTERVGELQARRNLLRRLATSQANTESGFGVPFQRSPVASGSTGPDERRALTALERAGPRLSHKAGERMESLVRGDPTGLTARLVAAAGDPDYHSAFGKILADPQGAQHGMTAAETEAVRVVKSVVQERAMGEGTGGAGQYLLPIQIDPTILLTSSGAINPIRQLARGATVSGYTWRGVASAGVVAQYQLEGAEAIDNGPSLSQPTVTPQRATTFVPLSFELLSDWADASAQIGELIQDAKDVLEASEFTNGTGVAPHPQGLLVGLGTGQRTLTGTTASLAVADIYDVRAALAPRWQPTAAWLASTQMLDTVYRLVAAADPVNPQLMPLGRGGPMLGKPVHELSALPTAVASGNAVAIYGDLLKAFLIVDRLGMEVQVIPHLFGAANHYPTGQTGIYAFWRNSAVVTVPEAATWLQVK